MDFLDSIRLLWRRRLVVLAGIVVTGLGCVLVLLNVQTKYSATAQYVLLLPSTANGSETPQNPIINQPTGLVLGAGLIAADINSLDTVRDMEAKGFKDPYSIALQPSSGPLLTIEVSGTDPDSVLAERDELLRRLDQRLQTLQDEEIQGIPRNQVIYSLTTAVNREAEAVPGAKVKALLAVVAAGGLATLLTAVSVDSLLMQRRQRKGVREEPPGTDTPPPPLKSAPPPRRSPPPGPVRTPSRLSEPRPKGKPESRPDKPADATPPEGPPRRPPGPERPERPKRQPARLR